MRAEEFVLVAAALVLTLLRSGTRADEIGRGVYAAGALVLVALAVASVIYR